MLSLTSQRTCFDIVISDLKRCGNSVAGIIDDLQRNGFTYYAIVHDKDVDSNGMLKRTHLHIVLCTLKRLRVKQLINLLADICETNNENIQVQDVLCLAGSIQYLLHINAVNKYQYERKEIITNDERNLDGYLLEQIKANQVTTKVLIDLIFVQECNKLELITSIGIGSYTHYRNTINDLYEIKARQKR